MRSVWSSHSAEGSTLAI